MSSNIKTSWSSIQRRIFSKINDSSLHDQALGLAELISKQLSIKKTASYQRINGKTPLKLSEILILIPTYNINLFEFLDDKASERVLINLGADPLVENLFDQLYLFLFSITKNDHHHKKSIFLSSPGIPLLFFISRPKLFLWLFCFENYLNSENKFDFEEEYAVLKKDSRILSLLKRLSASLNACELNIFIDKRIFEFVLLKIKYARRLGVISEMKQLLYELNAFVEKLESICYLSNKNENNTNLFLCEMHELESQIILSTGENETIIAKPLKSGQWNSHSEYLIAKRKRELTFVRNHSINISGNNQLKRADFFSYNLYKIKKLLAQCDQSKHFPDI